ncbi:gluconokinase [Actinomadura rubrisoli]|uniref:Gluconokinase n=1 Tax=Actinomadura rubrisoli TaxID=2530368 RepID=A0A4R5ARD8_9ACTN|nr:gluconokinase [Actinomadura rubrisoli]TDD75678.1 gluconokinase [Actinomadura rubrisoli]
MADAPAPKVIVLAGVSGSGKTTVGHLLAERLGWDYAEADDFHPPANIAKMAAGTPLNDADRLPWLRAIAAWIDDRLATSTPGIVTCSALKRSYRTLLTGGRPRVRLVLLDGDRDMIAARLEGRTGHFFRAALLDSQIADLEAPAPDEHVLRIVVDTTPQEITDRIIGALHPPADPH